MGSLILQASGSAKPPHLQPMRWLTWRGDEARVRLLVQCGKVSGCGGGHGGAADVEATWPQPSEHTARTTIGTPHHPATTPARRPKSGSLEELDNREGCILCRYIQSMYIRRTR